MTSKRHNHDSSTDGFHTSHYDDEGALHPKGSFTSYLTQRCTATKDKLTGKLRFVTLYATLAISVVVVFSGMVYQGIDANFVALTLVFSTLPHIVNCLMSGPLKTPIPHHAFTSYMTSSAFSIGVIITAVIPLSPLYSDSTSTAIIATHGAALTLNLIALTYKALRHINQYSTLHNDEHAGPAS